MKTRIVLETCLLMFLFAILPDTIWLADTNRIMPAMPVSSPHGGLKPTVLSRLSYPAPMISQGSRDSLFSAQQACLQGSGWNWRRGQVPICFKSGHNSCPAGYPWVRQRTQRYTICLSASRPGKFPPVGVIY